MWLSRKERPTATEAGNNWERLNFPTAEEEAFAEGVGMEPPEKKLKVNRKVIVQQ